jgi:hypothetical protein
MLKACVAVCGATVLESVTVAVKLTGVVLAGPVGVPVMAPLLLFKVNPAGKEPAETLYLSGDAPPVAAICPPL